MAKKSAAKVDDVVIEYLVENDEVVEALRVLAGCDYPVDDAPSLISQLDERGAGVATVLAQLEPTDFPLVGPRNAFDKLRARVTLHGWRPPKLEIPADRHELPAIYDIYVQTFGPVCAEVAYAEFQRAKRNGATDVAAIVRGHHAGRRCQEQRP